MRLIAQELGCAVILVPTSGDRDRLQTLVVGDERLCSLHVVYIRDVAVELVAAFRCSVDGLEFTPDALVRRIVAAQHMGRADHMMVVVEESRLIACGVDDCQLLAVTLEEGEARIAHVDHAELTLISVHDHVGIQVSAGVIDFHIVIELIDSAGELLGSGRTMVFDSL